MQSYFVPQRGALRRVLVAYCLNTSKQFDEHEALKNPLPELLQQSGLLPGPHEGGYSKDKGSDPDRSTAKKDDYVSRFGLHPSLGAVESLEISPQALNAFKLANLGAVHILWTNNVSRHMLLSQHAKVYYLELFAIPSAFASPGPRKGLIQAGVSSDLMEEIQMSYANLFHPVQSSWSHRYLGRLVFLRYWCWCLACSSRRLAARQIKTLKPQPRRRRPVDSKIRVPEMSKPPYDPLLSDWMVRDAGTWDQIEFESLWLRIVALDAHLAGSKPWSFWVIFRDRRDSVQFWTFLFGTVILILTFLQVFLGIAQVAGGFTS